MATAAAVSGCILAVVGNAASAAEPQAPWTAETSVNLRYFQDPNGDGGMVIPFYPSRHIVPSPDGRRFAFVTSRGDLASDTNIATLHVYDTEQTRREVARGRKPSPLAEVSHSSASNVPALWPLVWAADGRRIFFRGSLPGRDEDRAAFFSVDIAGRTIEQVTGTSRCQALMDPAAQILDWRGKTMLFMGRQPDTVQPVSFPTTYPIATVTREDMHALMRGVKTTSTGAYSVCLYRDGDTQVLGDIGRGGLRGLQGKFAPNERYAMINFTPSSAVADPRWLAYDAVPKNSSRPGNRFVLIDLQTKAQTPVLDAPDGTVTKVGKASTAKPDVLWTADGSTAILVNTAMPLTADAPERRTMAFVASYDVAGGSTEIVTPLASGEWVVDQVRWETPGTVLRIDFKSQKTEEARFYAHTGGHWVRTAPPPPKTRITWEQGSPRCSRESAMAGCTSSAQFPAPPPVRFSNGLSLLVDEGLNDPQRLVATVQGRSVVMIDRDPRLATVRLAPSRIVHWNAPDGGVEKAILTVPPGAPAGSPPPLVIQIGLYIPNAFRPDGSAASPYATQALAARGIAVLNMNAALYEDPELAGTPAEGQTMMRSLKGFIDTLAAQRLINPEQVGLAGHSRAGYMTYYAATHPGETRFAAFFDSDGYTASFSSYLTGGIIYDEPEDLGNNGGAFWQNREAWLEHSPEFNIHNIQGAFLYAMNGGRFHNAVLAESFLGAFYINRRPLEFINLSRGEHPLVRPRERLASLSTLVDWMAFWLKGELPADAERVERWTKMRADWQKQQAWEASGHPPGSWPESSN